MLKEKIKTMRIVNVTGPSNKTIFEKLLRSVVYGGGASITFKKVDMPEVEFSFGICKADLTSWNLPQSVFDNDLSLQKKIILNGYIYHETGPAYVNLLSRKCRVEIFTDKKILLKIRK